MADNTYGRDFTTTVGLVAVRTEILTRSYLLNAAGMTNCHRSSAHTLCTARSYMPARAIPIITYAHTRGDRQRRPDQQQPLLHNRTWALNARAAAPAPSSLSYIIVLYTRTHTAHTHTHTPNNIIK